jgi:methyl-accepting chemotaxis protein
MENRSIFNSIAVRITAVAFVVTAIAMAAITYIAVMYANDSVETMAVKLSITVAGILVILAMIMFAGIVYAIKPLHRVADVIEQVSELDLTADDDEISDLLDRSDEIGYLANCTVNMKKNITAIATDIQKLVS